MIKVVVTGGAGFIGSHLVDALLKRGFDVHVIDNLTAEKRENVNPRANLHQIDIRDFEKLGAVFRGAQYVFHAAALPRVMPSISDPRATHEVNATGTLNVLVAARDAGVKRVVYSASSSAYGEQSELPLKETMPASPLHPYGLQKWMGELNSALFSKLYNLETVSLRYFNVYGPRAPADGAYASVIARFLHQRKSGQALTLVPDGTATRDFTHVRDVVRANILAADSPRVGKGEVINIGAGKSWKILEVAELIGGPTVFIEPRIEAKHSLADIAKAKELLGWEPAVTFEQGIKELKQINGVA